MCTTLDPDLDITENEQVPGVAWGQAGKNAGKNAGKYAGVAWGQLSEQPQEAEETEEAASR
ncbi:MAG TPA: hypothetical protein VFQ68_04435 [Streptosporangiaceae bacterium]|nr:hypothetical protein [Streptosporangiaceae bacterium]